MSAPTPPSGPLASDIADAVVKVSPSGLLVAWNHLATVPAEKWLTYVTIGFVILQTVVLVRKEFLKRGGKRK
jgi:hypothetical protein